MVDKAESKPKLTRKKAKPEQNNKLEIIYNCPINNLKPKEKETNQINQSVTIQIPINKYPNK